MCLATFTPEAPSIPLSPGEAFTSISTGPFLERMRSTPATPSPKYLVAFKAINFSLGERLKQLPSQAP